MVLVVGAVLVAGHRGGGRAIAPTDAEASVAPADDGFARPPLAEGDLVAAAATRPAVALQLVPHRTGSTYVLQAVADVTTVPGARYEATARSRSRSPRTLCLQMTPGGRSCRRVAGTWATLGPVRWTSREATRPRVSVYARSGRAPFEAGAVRVEQVRRAPASSRLALSARALDHAHVRLDWRPVAGAVQYRVLRGDLLVGSVTEPGFTDALLWPETTYDYRVEATGTAGTATADASATTPALPRSGFPRAFPARSFWNTPVGAAPTARNSERLVAYVAAHSRNANLTLHEWGVAVAEAQPGDRPTVVPCTESWKCTLGDRGPVPMPLTAHPDPADDGHLAVYDPAAGREWGMWRARRTLGAWRAAAGAAVELAGGGLAPPNTAGANAANFPLLGGLVRPEEILQGRIDHALAFGLPGIGHGRPVCPATHNAPTTADPNAPREGQRLQLDPSLDLSALHLTAVERIVARALQVYGMYLRDNSGTLALYAENPIARGYDAWAKVGLGGLASAPLRDIPWSRFRVLAAEDCG